ncbi:MAG TPA: autotransporter-associated beta strand repeat-containing protein [Pirellulales bacterium]|jgi:autotransporter-associated beta strand protein
MQLRIVRSLLILTVSTLWCATSLAAPRPNIQERIDQLLVANGRRSLTIDTTSAGTLTLNTPSGPQLYQSGLVTLTGPIHVGSTSTGGSLVKVGAGTLTLSSANGFHGVTTISGGALNVTSGTSTGIGLTIHGGALNFTNGNVLSLDPPAANTQPGGGGLIISSGSTDGGSITQSGSNTYTGSTTINSGTLTLGSGSTYVGGTTTTTLQVSSTISSGTTATSGTLLVGNSGALNASGSMTLSNGISPLHLDGASSLGGAGTVVLNNSSNYTSAANATSGTLMLTGTTTYASTTTINAGAFTKLGAGTLTLSGTGSISGSLTHTSGIINSGNLALSQGIGTLTLPVALTLNGGTLQYDVDGSQVGNDLVNVMGGLNIAGSMPIDLVFLNNGQITHLAFTNIPALMSTISDSSALSSPVSAVPEPSAWTLGLIALTLLLLSRRLGV